MDGAVDTATVSWPATAQVIVRGLVEGLWQTGKTEWFGVVTVEVRMEKPRTFRLSCAVRMQRDGGKKGGKKQVSFSGRLEYPPPQGLGVEGFRTATNCTILRTGCRRCIVCGVFWE